MRRGISISEIVGLICLVMLSPRMFHLSVHSCMVKMWVCIAMVGHRNQARMFLVGFSSVLDYFWTNLFDQMKLHPQRYNHHVRPDIGNASRLARPPRMWRRQWSMPWRHIYLGLAWRLGLHFWCQPPTPLMLCRFWGALPIAWFFCANVTSTREGLAKAGFVLGPFTNISNFSLVKDWLKKTSTALMLLVSSACQNCKAKSSKSMFSTVVLQTCHSRRSNSKDN